ncbi:hypothetical protein KP509_35G051300 [Ceratopteris richardii]|uniref:Glucose-methanol-choline oxidoreductase C-terminal domain-containing protein n=1 Tax=Ceratopteris richardii TaxID=49495 RepID=A0A8T2QG61_CERRI|nr:hypothetical protein KP509_35G051300 [Ceratopteris richardii]
MQTASSTPNFNYGYPTPGPQSPTGTAVMDHVFFLSQTEWKAVREDEDFDFVVIGSGFCALAFIERALRNNSDVRILVLERGPFFLPEHFQNLPLPYQDTLGGMAETFPWTLSQATAVKQNLWQHGMVPFFGGRSTLWSAWCPRPTTQEMRNWPSAVIETAQKYFPHAEALLNVLSADKIDANLPPAVAAAAALNRPVFGTLQRELFKMLEISNSQIPSATRIIPAPLAVRSQIQGVDFEKFSVPGPLLSEIVKQRESGRGALKVLTNCVVQRILHQEGKATALQTSREMVNVGNAQIVLAMGTLPPTTLVFNSFPHLEKRVGKRFSSHFITAVVARVRRDDYKFASQLGELELAALYLAGEHPTTKRQYHMQITALSDQFPEKNAETAARHMPDVVATASMEQLRSSKEYVVFVFAVLGELDENNRKNWFLKNAQNADPTTNALLQVIMSDKDHLLRDQMDEATFEVLEKALCPKGSKVEYWHDKSSSWQTSRPPKDQIHVPGMVHESSTMHISDGKDAIVNLNYQLDGVENVYVTGGSLWPTGGSWNPTLTMVGLAQHLADKLTSPIEEPLQIENSKHEATAQKKKKQKVV